MSTWIPRPELNWCCNCWFNAKIESRVTKLGTMWLCLSCGIGIHEYNHEPGKGSLGEDLPRFFSRDGEEWKTWLKEYQAKD